MILVLWVQDSAMLSGPADQFAAAFELALDAKLNKYILQQTQAAQAGIATAEPAVTASEVSFLLFFSLRFYPTPYTHTNKAMGGLTQMYRGIRSDKHRICRKKGSNTAFERHAV